MGFLVFLWIFKTSWGWGQNGTKGRVMLTPIELVFTFGGSYVCANFGENQSRSATVRVRTDGYTDRLTDANRFYNLSHAMCYSCGADKYCCSCCHFVVTFTCVQFSCSVVSYYVDTPSQRSHSVNSGRHFAPRLFVC